MAETDKQSIPENLTNGKKILRVFDGFGDDVEDSFTRFFSDGAIDHDKKIAQLFESNGFEITTGEFNRNNPLEIGISSDDEVKSRDQYLEAAQKVGIDMPKTYSPIDVLQTSDIIVAKVPEADRGEMKYLLETTDQKVKFISWALLYQNISTLPPNKMSQKKVLDIFFEKISKGIFEDEKIDKDGRSWLDSWVFEEFIDTPGDFNSSIRVVVDAFGNFHYAQITKSQHVKNFETLLIPKGFTEKDLVSAGFDLTKLLTHPDSPFYLKSKNFMSNVAQGGRRILLDGNSVKNIEDRELLIQLGFDPDRPLLSADLLEKSKEIGKLYRKHYPHVGIDYLIQKGGKPFLLEINKGPHLSPQALGLTENTEPEDCELELMRRIISSLN